MRLLIHISIQKKNGKQNKTKQNTAGRKRKSRPPVVHTKHQTKATTIDTFLVHNTKKRLKKKNTHKKTQKKKTFKNEINRI